MMILKQLPDVSVSKVYDKTAGGAAVMFVLISGNKVMAMYEADDDYKQVVFSNDEKTNIYKSFTNDCCITCNVPGYSNTKSTDLGVGTVKISNEKLDNLKKIEMIASLHDNWNNNGAKAFTKKLIEKGTNIVMLLDIQPEVFPTACESLQLEYDKADGSHMEIELTENEDAEIFRIDSLGNESIIKIPADVEAINKVVNDFYG